MHHQVMKDQQELKDDVTPETLADKRSLSQTAYLATYKSSI